MDIRQIGCSTQLTPTYVGRGRGRGVLGLRIRFPNVGSFVSNVSSDEVTNPVPLVNGDNTEVQVFTQRKVKEPPSFRGDKTDTITFDD